MGDKNFPIQIPKSQIPPPTIPFPHPSLPPGIPARAGDQVIPVVLCVIDIALHVDAEGAEIGGGEIVIIILLLVDGEDAGMRLGLGGDGLVEGGRDAVLGVEAQPAAALPVDRRDRRPRVCPGG